MEPAYAARKNTNRQGRDLPQRTFATAFPAGCPTPPPGDPRQHRPWPPTVCKWSPWHTKWHAGAPEQKKKKEVNITAKKTEGEREHRRPTWSMVCSLVKRSSRTAVCPETKKTSSRSRSRVDRYSTLPPPRRAWASIPTTRASSKELAGRRRGRRGRAVCDSSRELADKPPSRPLSQP